MKKAVSAINIPVLGIHIGDTIAIAHTTFGLDSVLMAHSGMTFYNACKYEDIPEVDSEVYDAIRDAFDAGLELGYALNCFKQFMGIFNAKSIGDINRAMATCRATI